jgi:hypothetical protein
MPPWEILGRWRLDTRVEEVGETVFVDDILIPLSFFCKDTFIYLFACRIESIPHDNLSVERSGFVQPVMNVNRLLSRRYKGCVEKVFPSLHAQHVCISSEFQHVCASAAN